MNAYLDAIRRPIDFRGRSSRSQYWLFQLTLAVLGFVAILIDMTFGTGTMEEPAAEVTGLVIILHFIPSLSLAARRLHDSGHSGWWTVLLVLPLIGQIAFIVIGCLRSEPGDNRFGTQPAAQAPAPATAAAEAPRGATQSMAEPDQLAQIEKLAALRDSGAIDDEEYRFMKADVLSKA